MYEVNWANVQQQDIEMQDTFAHVAPVAPVASVASPAPIESWPVTSHWLQ